MPTKKQWLNCNPNNFYYGQVLTKKDALRGFRQNDINQEIILDCFRKFKAFWEFGGDFSQPHVELASGNCSNGFFNCMEVLQHWKIRKVLAAKLAIEIRKIIGNTRIDAVIGSPMSAINLADDVAEYINAPLSVFAEKDPKNSGEMFFRFNLPKNSKVLQIEELITTAHTLNAVQAAVEKHNPNKIKWIPVVGTLIHRPNKLPVDYYGERRIVALVQKEIWNIEKGNCPLCKAGSPRVKPKQIWQKFQK